MPLVRFLLLVGSSGISAASADALPGGFFYPAKRSVENVRLAFAGSDVAKAQLHLEFAQRRAAELSELIQSGNVQQLGPTAAELNTHLASATTLTASLEDRKRASH